MSTEDAGALDARAAALRAAAPHVAALGDPVVLASLSAELRGPVADRLRSDAAGHAARLRAAGDALVALAWQVEQRAADLRAIEAADAARRAGFS